MEKSGETKKYRRVVTGHAGGKSVIKSDEWLSPYGFKTVPGYEHTLVWMSSGVPELSREPKQADQPASVLPGPGGSSFHFVTFPPDSVFADPSLDHRAARQESLQRLPGLADTFERDDPKMHTTQTVDYAIVFEGEICLELDDEETVHLKRGDVVIQNGTRHGWRNESTKSATMLFVILGASKSGIPTTPI